jgi:Transaldolase/Fructose-6-phosphate aldolase
MFSGGEKLIIIVYREADVILNPRFGLMRFFLDTANLDELKTGASWGILDGVTTNPTLIAKEGVAMEDQIHRICEIVDGDVSAEVVATTRAATARGRFRYGLRSVSATPSSR